MTPARHEPSSGPAWKLFLEDGSELEGVGFGAADGARPASPVAGEVVFNTGMCGYVETLTDPSYRGQILVTTYPLIGNYGVPAGRAQGTLERPFEADHIQVQGLVVQNYVASYSHHAAERSLGDWLASEGVPAITGIDTRTLTRKLREKGTMRGWLAPAEVPLDKARATAGEVEMREQVFRLVAPKEPIEVFGVSGAAAMYRMSFLRDVAIGGEIFDEDFFAYREDADLAWRGRLLGWRAMCEPAAVAHHVRRVTPDARRELPPEINLHSVKNRFLLRMKNEGWCLALRNAPFELTRDLVVLAAALTVERTSLPAFAWLWRNRARVFAKRREIQLRRKVSDRQIARWFS